MHEGSCELTLLAKVIKVIIYGYRYYIPIHFLPMLIWKRYDNILIKINVNRKQLKKNPVKTLMNTFINYSKSLLSISLLVGLAKYL